MAAYRRVDYLSHLRADCLYTVISATIYLFSLRKLVSQLRCGCLVVSVLSVK